MLWQIPGLSYISVPYFYFLMDMSRHCACSTALNARHIQRKEKTGYTIPWFSNFGQSLVSFRPKFRNQGIVRNLSFSVIHGIGRSLVLRTGLRPCSWINRKWFTFHSHLHVVWPSDHHRATPCKWELGKWTGPSLPSHSSSDPFIRSLVGSLQRNG